MCRSRLSSPILGILLIVSLTCGCVPLGPHNVPSKIQESAVFVGKGVLALRAGKLDEAQAAFLLANELHPTASALDGLGCVAFRRKDLKEAERYFLAAIDKEPFYSAAYGNLALVYELRGNAKRAQLLYQSALERDPKNFRARNNFAGVLSEQNYEAVARQELLKAQTVKPDTLIDENLKALGF